MQKIFHALWMACVICLLAFAAVSSTAGVTEATPRIGVEASSVQRRDGFVDVKGMLVNRVGNDVTMTNASFFYSVEEADGNVLCKGTYRNCDLAVNRPCDSGGAWEFIIPNSQARAQSGNLTFRREFHYGWLDGLDRTDDRTLTFQYEGAVAEDGAIHAKGILYNQTGHSWMYTGGSIQLDVYDADGNYNYTVQNAYSGKPFRMDPYEMKPYRYVLRDSRISAGDNVANGEIDAVEHDDLEAE